MTLDRIQQLEKEIYDLKNSLSFKLGFFLTFPARKIYDIFQYLLKYVNSKRNEFSQYKNIIDKYKSNGENVIFTFIFGNYDNLKEPILVSEGWDYLCFTDNIKLKSDVWQIIYLDKIDLVNYPLSSKKKAMLIMIEYYKYISKKYKIVISVGGQITINYNLNDLIRETFDINKFDLGICKHRIRDCIYDDAELCKKLGKDSAEVIDRQISRYKEEGFPAHNNLYETGFMIRKNRSRELKKVCTLWAKELYHGSKRDQLSLNYAIWKANSKIRINEIESYKYLDRRENVAFIICDHLIT